MDESTEEHFKLFFKQIKRKDLSIKDEYGVSIYSPFVHWYGSSKKADEDDIFLLSEGGSRMIEAILCKNIIYDRYEDGVWLERGIKKVAEEIESKARFFLKSKTLDVYFWKKTGYMIEWDVKSFEELTREEKVEICHYWLVSLVKFSTYLKNELKKSVAVKTCSL